MSLLVNVFSLFKMLKCNKLLFTAVGVCFVVTVLAWLRGCVLCANVEDAAIVAQLLNINVGG